jgi:HPt (histidine-containing phosphotransfer) domain-containing protein
VEQQGSMELSQAQKLLRQLRDDYLNDLAGSCDQIENLVLSLNLSFKGNFEELYRRVHSIKGSAGTHGLMVISTLCHDFEELLNRLSEGGGQVEAETTGMALHFVDLIRQARSIAIADSSDFSEIEKELERLRQKRLRNLYPALLVESSGSVKMLCQESLSGLPVQLTIEPDGYAALGQLLRSRFAFLITANEARTLNGQALISALRASDSINRDIKTILLTSRPALRDNTPFKPDYVVSRNTELAESLPRVVQEIIAGLQAVKVNRA